jgi:hypothetical protein
MQALYERLLMLSRKKIFNGELLRREPLGNNAWGSARSAPWQRFLEEESMRRKVIEQSRFGRNAWGRRPLGSNALGAPSRCGLRETLPLAAPPSRSGS